MTQARPPWGDLPGVDNDLIASVTKQVTDAVGDLASQAGGLVEQVGSVVPTKIPTSGTTGSSNSGSAPVGGIDVGAIVGAAAQQAIQVAQKDIATRVQSKVEEALTGLGDPQLATIPAKDLKKVDAWERAGRTFATGLLITVLAGLVQVIGDAVTHGQVNFFSQAGWSVVGTLAVGSVFNSVFSYLLRYLREPAGAAIDSAEPKKT